MKPSSLDEHVRDHFESVSPSPQLLDRLVAATRESGVEPDGAAPGASTARAPGRAARSAPKRLLWAAMLVLTASGGWLVQAHLATLKTARDVAAEIAMNHVRDLDVEVRATTWEELRRGLDKLDFVLADSTRLQSRRLRLQGGRYCSIQGRLAAQVRLLGPGGNHLTLYQTAATEDLESLDRTLAASGVEIEMWIERGLFFGLAK